MTAPLMMIGPGGDYVTRFDIKGEALVKSRTQAAAGNDPDAQSAGGNAAWGWLGRRKKDKQTRTRSRARSDRFEHAAPQTLPASYAGPALAEPHQQRAMIQAIENWLVSQQAELDRLAAIQTATEASLARAQPAATNPSQSQAASAAESAADSIPPAPTAPVRVIRYNSKTMDLPAPTPVRVPEPCHNFATEPAAEPAIASQTNPPHHPNPSERSVHHDQSQPHPQADENLNADSRHPAIARLFADDERARRSLRRLKSHGLRARRSAHQKGLPDPRCEQGALFGAVA